MASAPSLIINLPGYPWNNLPSVATIALLRVYGIAGLDDGADIIVDEAGLFHWDASSLAVDDNATIIRPTVLTPLQAGRWILTIGNGGGNPNPGVYYSLADEPTLPGESDDNGRYTRAQAKIHDPSDIKHYGLRLWFNPGRGSYVVNPADPIIDPTTGVAMDAFRLPKTGDWMIDDFASYTPEGIAKANGSTLANTWLEGAPGLTRFVKSPNKHYFLFAYNAGTGTVANPNEQYWNIPNITIKGITFVEANWRYGFFESFACISVHAVDNLLIEGCTFLSWRGDAIYVGASDKGDGTENRHNRNVVIRNNVFDGYNMNNRNPISVQDGSGGKVHDNIFRNCCKPGGGGTVPFNSMVAASGLQMPASMIDFEPNIEVANPMVRDWEVFSNIVENGGGDAANVFLRANDGIPNKQTNVSIHDNDIHDCRSGIATFLVENSIVPYNVTFTRNKVRSTKRAFQILRSEGLFITDNLFEECQQYGDIGYETSPGNFDPAAHSVIARNRFRKIGNDGAGAFVIGASQYLTVEDNEFVDNSMAGFILRGNYTHTGLLILRNKFYPSTRQTVAIGAVTSGGFTPAFNQSTCLEAGNIYNGLPNFGFAIPGSRITGPVDTGVHPVGAKFPGPINAGPGDPEFWIIKKSGLGLGNGDTGSGNDRDVWFANLNSGLPEMLTPSGVMYAINPRIAGGISYNNGTWKSLIGNDLNFAIAVQPYDGAVSFTATVQAPILGSIDVETGFTLKPAGQASTAVQTDMLIGLKFNGTNVIVVKKGIDQSQPNAGFPNTVPYRSGQTFRYSYSPGGGQGNFFVTDPDTGVETKFGQTNEPATTANYYPIVKLPRANQSVRIPIIAQV